MKRRILSSLMALVLCLTLLPAAAYADGGTAVYVSSAGDDTAGNGSQSAPYATLAKAVDVAKDGATIYVMSDLTMTECARYYDKDLTITSLDPNDPVTIFRGTKFDRQNDPRSWYNPALIEVQTKGEAERCGLILHHIILDDKGLHEGSIFAQASSGSGTNQIDNTTIVQDAMIASNATVPCTITLGEGAILRNFGGMSAVRATGAAKLVMQSGSVIEDTSSITRSKGDAGSVGPAGAVWLQGSGFEMESGAEIKKINGRAIYADGGEVTIGGTISGITGNANMWQGEDGTAIHLRGSAKATLNGEISNCTKGVLVFVDKAGFEMATGSFLGNSDAAGIKTNEDPPNWSLVNKDDYGTDRNTITIHGEISDIKNNKTPIQFKFGTLLIGADSNIHHNSVSYGTLYIQRDAIVDIYGKINNNDASKRGGGVATAGHGEVVINMYEGAEVKGNTAVNTGGGIMISSNTSFTMYGGEISGNVSQTVGGGIYQYKNNSKVELQGGTIRDNTMNATDVKDSSTGTENDITISNQGNGSSNHYLYISQNTKLDNQNVYFQINSKTVTPAEGSLDIKLGNASTDSKAALKNASNGNGWADPFATFWAQRDGAAELTVGGLNPDKNLPVYVLTQKTGANGKPDSTAVNTYVAAVDDAAGNVRFTLPAADVNGCGCAVAIVQPTQDFGTLTISGPETIKQNKTGKDHSVPYTVKYVMSESLKNIITQAGGSAEYSLVITKDARLTGTPDSFDGNSIQVTYMLPNDAFVVGDSLFASAELTVTVGGNRYVIPSKVTKTKLLGLESFHVVFDWNDGSGKTETVSVTEGEALGDRMIADPARSGYTFTGWNTPQDGKGSSFDNSTVITGSRTVYAQWSENSSGGGGGSTTYYYFAIQKVDAQDGHALNGATFELYQLDKNDRTVNRRVVRTTQQSSKNGIALFGVDNKNSYDGIWYYAEVSAPEGYVLDRTEYEITAKDFSDSLSTAVRNAGTVQNNRGTTPSLLNGDDHFAYIIGSSDALIRPNDNITRAGVATIFFRLLKDSVRDANLLTGCTYTDVPDGHWANTAISTMTGLDIVRGYDAAAFGPGDPITRAQFAAICARFDTGKSNGSRTFSDIKGHWAKAYIERAAELGWISGFQDGTFRPDAYITRAQAATMINRMLNRVPEDPSDLLPGMNVWPDCRPGDWFYLAIQEATNSHDFKRKAGSYETWTRLTKDPDWTRYEN